MNRRIRTLAFALVLIPGCAPIPPDPDFGGSVAAARQQMRLNPNPQPLSDTSRSQDGPAASESVQRYRDSFKAPPPTFVIFGPTDSGSR
jgi:hypothetical protein